jgi:hypothetical protein
MSFRQTEITQKLRFGHFGICGMDLVDKISFGEGHDGNSLSMEWEAWMSLTKKTYFCQIIITR